MRLSKFISCVLPITTIAVGLPILSSCSKKSLTLQFGDSINCFSRNKQYTDIASYHSYNEVFAAVKKHVAGIEPAKDVSISFLNSNKNFQSIYWDFVAGKLMSNLIVFLNNTLNVDDNSFDKFKFEYKLKDDKTDEPILIDTTSININNFSYESKEGKVYIRLNYEQSTASDETPSYIYQDCIAIN